MMPESSDSSTKRSTYTEKLARAESHILEFICYRSKFALLSNPTFSWYEHKLGQYKIRRSSCIHGGLPHWATFSQIFWEDCSKREKKKSNFGEVRLNYYTLAPYLWIPLMILLELQANSLPAGPPGKLIRLSTLGNFPNCNIYS